MVHYDVSDPPNPVQIDHLAYAKGGSHTTFAYDIAIEEGLQGTHYLYVANGTDGLRIYHCTPVLVVPFWQGSGFFMTDLDADNITHGTLPDTHLSTNVARLDGSQVFTGTNAFLASVSAPAFLGSGSLLTDLDASRITVGVISTARMDTAMALRPRA